jgi:hypothetical protein
METPPAKGKKPIEANKVFAIQFARLADLFLK